MCLYDKHLLLEKTKCVRPMHHSFIWCTYGVALIYSLSTTKVTLEIMGKTDQYHLARQMCELNYVHNFYDVIYMLNPR